MSFSPDGNPLNPESPNMQPPPSIPFPGTEEPTMAESVSDTVDLQDLQFTRPERIIHPDVSAIAVPRIERAGGSVRGLWRLLVRWEDGLKEELRLSDHLQLPDGADLYFTYQPSPPRLNPATQAWSLQAQKEWLSNSTSPSPTALYEDLQRAVATFVAFPEEQTEGARALVCCYTLLTYVYPAWDSLPYVHLLGPHDSGKTTKLMVDRELVFRPFMVADPTKATLFRTLHDCGGTLLNDEADPKKWPKGLKEVLNIGYQRGASVPRMKSDGNGGMTIEHFDVFGPKILAGTETLPPSLASRCVPLRMLRAKSNDNVATESIRQYRWQPIRDGLHSVALDFNSDWLRLSKDMSICPPMFGREKELWQPLLAMAKWWEEQGVPGVHNTLSEFAQMTIQIARDEQDSYRAAAGLLIQILATMRVDNAKPTPAELLREAKRSYPDEFRTYTPHQVANVLRRYGIRTAVYQGNSRYHRVTLAQLKSLAERYGFYLTIDNAEASKPRKPR